MDFYIILGLTADASTAEIKRAYRRLSRRYHPDINPGDRAAEALFQRVSEAYETLVDPGRRRQYDASGAPQHGGSASADREPASFIFREFDFSVTRQGAQASTFTELFADILHPVPPPGTSGSEAGADIHMTLTMAFDDAARGVERQIVVTRQVVCGGCAGVGAIAVAEGRCAHCHGSGHIRWARGHMVFSKPCAACGGSGRQTWQQCAVCGGHGRTVRSEAVGIVVPPGITDGSHLRLPERGHAGGRGGRAGDLHVIVRVEPHPVFRREGDDLVCELPVAVHEAVLGARVDVPTLDGPAKLRIPPGTQAGRRLRLEERGVATTGGGRGDIVFEVTLVLPQALDDRSKGLMREFGELNAADVRSGLFKR